MSRRPNNVQQGTTATLRRLDRNGRGFRRCEKAMQDTIGNHVNKSLGGNFSRYEIVKVHLVWNQALWDVYKNRKDQVARENGGSPVERLLFHASPNIDSIVQNGFDERYANMKGMFGAGIYFARNSSKSNQYVYGLGGGTGCSAHGDKSCYVCTRKLLLCRVTLGKVFVKETSQHFSHAPPEHHSVLGKEKPGGLMFREYVIYRGDQAFPSYLITYKLVPPTSGQSPRDAPAPVMPTYCILGTILQNLYCL